MVNILAIDASTDASSAAISFNGNIISYEDIIPKAHTKILLPMINRLLKEAALHLTDLNAFAFGRGPGSFTGIRIACSVIQALSFGLNKPVIPVSTLQALAQGAYREMGKEQVFASLDARFQEIYWGLFVNDGKGIMRPVSEEKVQPFLQIQLPAGSWHHATGFPKAVDIVEIACIEYQAHRTFTAEHALPVYLQNKIVR